MTVQHDTTSAVEHCIENCQMCHHLCLELVPHCLEMGGDHATPAHIRMLLDCAQICQTSADFMLRRSDYHARTCDLCAEICEACAKDCEKIAGTDAAMKACVDQCYQCAASCRNMANNMAAGHQH